MSISSTVHSLSRRFRQSNERNSCAVSGLASGARTILKICVGIQRPPIVPPTSGPSVGAPAPRSTGALAKRSEMKIAGTILMVIGLTIALFSNKIVFPGLERLLGIETIVGKNNVIYLDGGGYMYTNPGAMVDWIASVAGIGIIVFGTGLLLFRKKHRN
jgi:hypothetical protein